MGRGGTDTLWSSGKGGAAAACAGAANREEAVKNGGVSVWHTANDPRMSNSGTGEDTLVIGSSLTGN